MLKIGLPPNWNQQYLLEKTISLRKDPDEEEWESLEARVA